LSGALLEGMSSAPATPVTARRVLMTWSLKPDPPVREDGLCACGCGRKRKLTKQARRYAGQQLDMDPFASADCCRRYHGVAFKTVRDIEQDAA
jgi:hypothetical protein